MKFVVITGMSGAGKTQVLRRLEDIGFCCIDNLPASMLSSFVDICNNDETIDRAAIVMDSRIGKKLKEVLPEIEKLRGQGHDIDIIFLDAQDASLVRRFKATHRVHPIKDCTLSEGIEKERKIFETLKEAATHDIDTSNLNSKELNSIIDELYKDDSFKSDDVMIFVNTFGFKRGIPLDADLVFDVRFLPNPYWIEELKPYCGQDPQIQQYLLEFPKTKAFLDKLYDMVQFLIPLNRESGKDQLKIAIGCTGGMHRSVAVAEMLNQKLLDEGYHVIISHRDMHKDGTAKK